MSTKRIFFALWPTDRQRDQLRNAIAPVGREIEGNAVYRGEWHITLAFVGDFNESLVPALHQAARLIPVTPFRLRFDRAEYWPRPKVGVLVAPTVPPELEHLVLSLEILLSKIGIEPEHKTYRPHITIVRRSRPFETRRLAQPAVVEWSDFELIESVHSPRGSVYQPIKQ